MTEIERKYVLTKLAAGDYLLPSNDALTIWRISVYEDGPSHGLDDWPKDITLWSVLWWSAPRGLTVDIADTERWTLHSDGHRTRAEAIRAALIATPGEQTND